MRRLLFFTKGSRSLTSSRVRAFLIADYLRTLGWDAQAYHVQTRPWWDVSWKRLSEFWRNLRLIVSLRKGDVLYAQRTVYQIDFMLMVLLRRWLFKGKYVFDIDDAIFLEKAHVSQKTQLMVRYAALVIASNEDLKKYVLQYNQNVFLIPTLLNTDQTHRPPSQGVSPRIRIGWTGTAVHYDNLMLVIQPLQRLVDEGYPIEFIQVGGGDRIHGLLTSVKGLIVTYISNLAWDDPVQSARYVGQFDIGIAPLQKTEWNRGKDMWKTKEYMACEAVVVISNWGEGVRAFKDGVNGLIADTEEDWYRILKRLILDADYRKQIAVGGKSYVENTCSYHVFIPKLISALETVA